MSAIAQKEMKSPKALLSGDMIDGVRYRSLTPHHDQRGSFTEIFYDTWDTGIAPRQWSAVASKANVLRGMHLHLRHDEYISVLSGRACVGLYDLRKNSPTFQQHSLIELNGKAPACISFPIGLLHAWYFYEDSIHVQAISETYADYGDDDNWGCNFSDPELGIPWPNLDPIISERAQNFLSLGALSKIIDDFAASEEVDATAKAALTRFANSAVISANP